MKKAGLIGYNTSHSLSPAIHHFFFKRHNIVGQYKTFSITSAQLESIIKKLAQEGYTGFNVTTPYKETIIPLLDSIDETASKIGAVNTVLINGNKLIGYNTDAYGFLQGIKSQFLDFQFNRITSLVLGAGGASRAVLYALNIEGVKRIYLCNRTFTKAELLSQKFKNITPIKWEEKENILKRCDLVVNTTPLSTHFISLRNLPKCPIVNDIIYFPTDLLQQASDNGIGGLGMLMWQAERAFRIWFQPDCLQG